MAGLQPVDDRQRELGGARAVARLEGRTSAPRIERMLEPHLAEAA